MTTTFSVHVFLLSLSSRNVVKAVLSLASSA